jgi:Heavy metal associated domain 2
LKDETIVWITSSYIHALNGRLRIKVPEVKGAPPRVLDIEGRLRRIDGIDQVAANPTTGNVLILYNAGRITQQRILNALYSWGYLREQSNAQMSTSGVAATRPSLRETLAETLVRSTLELALQGLVRALI